jgi:hypothetical protein
MVILRWSFATMMRLDCFTINHWRCSNMCTVQRPRILTWPCHSITLVILRWRL